MSISWLNGFVMNALAPFSMRRVSSLSPFFAVRMITGTWLMEKSFLMRCSSSAPSMRGIIRSVMIISGWDDFILSRPSAPSMAVTTLNSLRSCSCSIWRKSELSSTSTSVGRLGSLACPDVLTGICWLSPALSVVVSDLVLLSSNTSSVLSFSYTSFSVGISRVKATPVLSGKFSAHILPWCMMANSRARLSPIPVPVCCVSVAMALLAMEKRSNMVSSCCSGMVEPLSSTLIRQTDLSSLGLMLTMIFPPTLVYLKALLMRLFIMTPIFSASHHAIRVSCGFIMQRFISRSFATRRYSSLYTSIISLMST